MPTVYITKNKNEADLICCVVNSKLDADILVYYVNTRFDAKEDFLWYQESTGSSANSKIYFTDSKLDAKLKVFFVNSKFDAKWQKSHSMHGRI